MQQHSNGHFSHCSINMKVIFKHLCRADGCRSPRRTAARRRLHPQQAGAGAAHGDCAAHVNELCLLASAPPIARSEYKKRAKALEKEKEKAEKAVSSWAGWQ
jgi:hypothetical protein